MIGGAEFQAGDAVVREDDLASAPCNLPQEFRSRGGGGRVVVLELEELVPALFERIEADLEPVPGGYLVCVGSRFVCEQYLFSGEGRDFVEMPGGVVGQGSGVGVVGIVVGSRGRDLPAHRRRAEFVEVARIIPYRETVVRRFRAAYEGDGEVLVGDGVRSAVVVEYEDAGVARYFEIENVRFGIEIEEGYVSFPFSVRQVLEYPQFIDFIQRTVRLEEIIQPGGVVVIESGRIVFYIGDGCSARLLVWIFFDDSGDFSACRESPAESCGGRGVVDLDARGVVAQGYRNRDSIGRTV